MTAATQTVEATLLSFGWLPWADARALLAGSGGTWLGPSGVTTVGGDEWPEKQPLTTRIHAWTTSTPTTLWRLVPRTEDSTVLVTALVVGPAPDRPGAPSVQRIVKAVRESDKRWERTTVHESSAVTFLRPVRSATDN